MWKWCFVVVAFGCSAQEPTPSDGSTQVLVEIAPLVDSNALDTGLTLLTPEGETTRITLANMDVAVQATVAGDNVHIDLRVTANGNASVTNQVLGDSQLMVVAIIPGHALIVRPSVIHDQADLRHAYERKQRGILPRG